MLTVKKIHSHAPAFRASLYNACTVPCRCSASHPRQAPPTSDMAGKVIRDLAEWLIIAFVAFALIFEIVLHKLEHWIMHRHPHIQNMLRNLYRELMILGIISFCFIMYIFTNDPPDDIKMTFEVSHVWVFLFACFHTFVVGLCIYISLGLSKRWKNLERMELVKYLEHKQKYRTLTDRRNKHKNFVWRHIGWWLTSPGKYFQYSKLHECMVFHDLRWQFIYYRNLAPEFRFSKYLRKIKFATFVELVEINPFCWLILIGFVLLDLLRNIPSFKGAFILHADFEAAFLIAHACLNMILVTVLARKIRNVYWKLTKNPATYYDNIDPSAFRTELEIAEEMAKIRKETGEVDSFNDVASRNKHTRIAPPRASRDSQEKTHHHAIHHNMAYVPEHHNTEVDQRYSLDVSKAMVAGSDMESESSVKPTQYKPVNEEELIESTKRARQRKSTDIPGMFLTMPVNELDHRARPSHDVQMEDPAMKRMSSSTRNLRMEALRRLGEKKVRNAAIVENAQDVQAAQSAAPRRQYHWIIVKMFPRLGRVSSAAEKLFWLGSHRFYLFCVELILFFTNVNVSTAIAKLAFNYKERNYLESKAKKAAGKAAGTAAKFIVMGTVRAAKDAGAKAGATAKTNDPFAANLALMWIAFAMGLVAMVFVLLRIADIMKKYIFVLNNANLLSETVLTQTIHTISLKDAMEEEAMRKHDDGEGNQQYHSFDSDSDDDGFENYSQMRRNMSAFLENEGAPVTDEMGELTPLSPAIGRV